jgi:hypothetical protein
MFHRSDRKVSHFARHKGIAVLQQVVFAGQLQDVLGVGMENANRGDRADNNQN